MILFKFQFFILCLLCVLLSACGFPELSPKPKAQKAISLKVVNYNLWHSLEGTGYFSIDELEPELRKQKRYEEQIRLFKETKPDILFVQEVHPSVSRAEEIAEELNMSHVLQKTNCGVSLFGFGLPLNLNVGVAILTRPPLKIEKILGLKLSGPIGDCNPYLTFQYGEFRYALFALAYHPDYGSFLLVNTHFHHGVEWSPEVRAQIQQWKTTKVLDSSQIEELEGAIEESNQRREEELTNLFNQIKELREYYKGLPLILAGDFNSGVASPIYKKIIETHKMKDSMGNYVPIPYTWDPLNNKENHQYTKNFEVSVPTFDKEEVKDFFKQYDSRQRRIDYIFVSDDVQILSHFLFADKPHSGIIGSDHFGVEVQLNIGQEHAGSK